MKTGRTAILLFVLVFVNRLSGQTFYIAEKNLIKTNPQNWAVTVIGDFSNNVLMTDISLNPNGKLYGFGQTEKTLFEINPADATLTPVYTMQVIVNGMVSAPDGKIYLAFEHLYSYDPATGQFADLGQMNYTCAGDLIFWNGDLYMTEQQSRLVKINLQQLDQCEKYLDLPPDQAYFGLADEKNCLTGQNNVYAFTYNGPVYKIDMVNRTTSLAPGPFFTATGACSTDEYVSNVQGEAELEDVSVVQPDCGQNNGSIHITPADPAQGLLFSLDNQNWQSSGVFENLGPGVYLVYVQNACRPDPVVVVMTSSTAPEFPEITNTPAYCTADNGIIELGPGAPGVEFSLDQISWHTAPYKFENLGDRQYTLTARSASGCVAAKQIAITRVIKEGALEMIALPAFCAFKPLDIVVPKHQDAVFTWTVNGNVVNGVSGGHLIASYTEQGDYLVQVVAVEPSSCRFEAAMTYKLIDCFEIPNVFSPNGDELNDVFKPATFGLFVPFDIEIYNRWGQRVFRNDDDHLYWDGRVDGKEAASDVYAYIIKTRTEPQQEFKGSVTLLR